MFARACVFLVFSATAFCQQSPDNADWHKPFPRFRIVGNLYYVGTYDLACYLITTPQGHILVNTGMPDSVAMIQANVESLGFKMSDIKILTATHGHIDHVAGMAQLKRITGAKLMMSELDAALLEDGGKSDFRFGDDADMHFEPVKVDQTFKDGEKISLGGVELTAHGHPGHTKGATSFTMNIAEEGRTYRVGIVNMGSINPGVFVSGMPGYPGIREAYARTFHDQNEMQIDIWLASHAAQFDMHGKFKPGDPYDPNRFMDPDGFHAAVKRLETTYREHLYAELGAEKMGQ